ncbi:serine/threonine-protein kinase [Nocardia arthritidis]|nr:serine/threonine-protein kinase [Nocardia arthritidis]
MVEGTVFAGYRIERLLGAGGMGAVYLARHPRLPRHDALKLLADNHAADPEYRARFLREAEIAVRLQHPNLVAVRDRGEEAGQLWITMQYVPGLDLAAVIARNPRGLAVERALWILGEAARGLDEVHDAGLLHRDVKPANILITGEWDGPDRALVTDFGIARAAEDSATSAVREPTASLAYAAPEQIRGDAMDRRADVYALGCTLFHMLTGSVPFPRESPGAVMYAHLNEDPPLATRENPGVPAELAKVVVKAMAKRPEDRYPSCGALATAARTAFARSLAAESGASEEAGRKRGRWLLSGVALAVIVIAAVAISAFAWSGDGGSDRSHHVTAPVPRVNAALWSTYTFMVEPFADLLPPGPFLSGYRDLSGCQPVDAANPDVDLPFDQSVKVGELLCVGDHDPVTTLVVECNADRTPILPRPSTDRVEGEERWSRPSGTGRLRWGSNTTNTGARTGWLYVYFDGPDRNFCNLTVSGTGSGTELRGKWWPDAPL